MASPGQQLDPCRGGRRGAQRLHKRTLAFPSLRPPSASVTAARVSFFSPRASCSASCSFLLRFLLLLAPFLAPSYSASCFFLLRFLLLLAPLLASSCSTPSLTPRTLTISSICTPQPLRTSPTSPETRTFTDFILKNGRTSLPLGPGPYGHPHRSRTGGGGAIHAPRPPGWPIPQCR